MHAPARDGAAVSLQRLLAQLNCGDDELAEAAAQALPEFGGHAVAALSEMCASENVELRWGPRVH